RDVLAGNHAADDVVLEDEALAALQRLDVDDHVTILSAATGLAHETALDALDRAGDRLAIRHLRTANVGMDLEFAQQAIDDDFQMKLAHAHDNRLAGFLIGPQPEGGILFGKPRQRHAHLVLVSARLRLDRDFDDRLREADRFQDDRVIGVAQRVAGEGLLQADDGADIAGRDLVDLLPVIGVHLKQTPDALALPLG